MFSLRNKKKNSLNYPQYSLLSGAVLIRHLLTKLILLTGCDIYIKKDYGVLQSPGYKSGNQYPNNLSCSWFLDPSAQRESTLIIDSLDTESTYDTLQVNCHS